jgi:hypothetical protein
VRAVVFLSHWIKGLSFSGSRYALVMVSWLCIQVVRLNVYESVSSLLI